MYSWGAGIHGQLGLGEEKFSAHIPTEVEQLSDKNVVNIFAKGDVSAAITDDGDVYVWGKSKGGALGSQFTQNLI